MLRHIYRTILISTVALAISACKHSPGSVPLETTDTNPPPNAVIFDKQLSFLTHENRTAYKWGYEYAALQFQVTSFNQADNEKLKATIGNFLRRFIWEEDHAASLVLTVTKNLPDPGTGVIQETTIVEVPIFSVVYDEEGVPSETTMIDTGRQIIPWFRVEAGERINFSYTIRASQDARPVLAEKIVELGKTSATLVGSAGAWVLNELTAPHISNLATTFDSELSQSFSFARKTTRKVELGILTDDLDRYAAVIDVRDTNEAIAAKIQVGLIFRPTQLSDTWDATTRVPVIEKSPVTIKSLRAGVRNDQNLEWLIETRNKSWYPNWKTASDTIIFAEGCENLLKEFQYTAKLGFHDAAAAMWAELSSHQGYLQTAKFHEVNCLDTALKARLKALGMEIPKPVNTPQERQLTIEERDKSLDHLIALMLQDTPDNNAELFAEQVFEERVELHDPEGLLGFNAMIEAGRGFTARTLRELNIRRAGCYISSPTENAATRHFIALHDEDRKIRMLQIEATFSLVGPAGSLPRITAIKVSRTTVEDDFVSRIRQNRGVFSDDHSQNGKPRGCGKEYDWYPWNEVT